MTWPDIIPVYSMAAGAAYIIIGGFVDMASRHMPGVKFIAEGTTGFYEGLIFMEEMAQRGKAAMCSFGADGIYQARLGEGQFDAPLTEVYQGSWVFANELWLTTPVSSGIRSMEDVAGKRMAVGGFGSAIYYLTKAYLEAYGVTFDDFKPTNSNYEGANAGMQDGSLDGGFYGGPPPFAPYEDLASSMDIIAIGIGRDKADQILAEHPYYLESVLPAGIMAGVSEDQIVLCISNVLGFNSAMSDELVYAILEMIYDNLDEFREYSPRALRDMELDNWYNTVVSDMHPGAIKFFTDKGVYNR